MERNENRIIWNTRNVITLIVCIAIPLIIGAVSAFLTRNAMSSFESMNKPPLAPPGWLFPIAWTILYILMGIASFLMLRHNYEEHLFTLFIYCLQLLINFTWSIIFFTYEAYVFAAVWLALLVIMIIFLIIKTSKFSIPAMIMLIPYLAWCLFAMYLNVGIAVLN